ncbi:MAG TPA: hypothetical protein VEV83_13865 [Parafilimonas sp.]|nr:hypothetical protein [Parafilimonas sp.]
MMEEEIDFGFQSRVERFIYWSLMLLRADARSRPGMTAGWVPYVPAANWLSRIFVFDLNGTTRYVKRTTVDS